MAWIYAQRTGKLFHDGHLVGTGWAGHSAGRNNPEMQFAHGVGPLPVGWYSIGDPMDAPAHLGPCALPLTPSDSNDMGGRGDFFMHGASAAHPDMSSDGCIIMQPAVRHLVNDSDDGDLQVVAEDPA